MLFKGIIRNRLKLLTLSAICCGLLCATAQAYNWPDPLKHHRVILYSNQNITELMQQHPDWFADDFMIAGLSLSYDHYGDSDNAIEESGALYQKFRLMGISVGSYISGTTVSRELSLLTYPAKSVSIEDLPRRVQYIGPWSREPDQQVVDLSHQPSRYALENGIRQIWLHLQLPIHFVDNAAVHPKVAPMQPWQSYCENIRALRTLSELMNSSVIFNVFVRPWEMNDEEMNQLTDAVGAGNAVSLPMPWSLSIEEDKNANGWAIYRYRQILDRGLAVIMIPSAEAPIGKLIHWVSTWKRATDRIYYFTPVWEAPPF